MLIAIMGESFEQVTQQAHFAKMVERLEIIEEHSFLFNKDDDE